MTPSQKPGRSKQDYGTPPEFLAAVKRYMRISDFGWDLAASAENAVTSSFISQDIDALDAVPWPNCGGYNWLNPPYSKIAPWVEKAWLQLCAYRTQTVMLVPAAVGSNWWRDWVHEKARVKFLNPRLTFVGCKDPYPKDCALLLYGQPYGYECWTWKSADTSTDASANLLVGGVGNAVPNA